MSAIRERGRDDRGAAALILALCVTLIVGIGMLAVDLGMQRVVRRDMQSVADVVALDLARRLDGSTASALTTTLNAARDRSVARNADTLGDTPTVTYQLGKLADDGTFTPVTGSGIPAAVKVHAESAVTFAFNAGKGSAAREAIATVSGGSTSSCFKVGSYAGVSGTNVDTFLNSFLQKLGGQNSAFNNSNTGMSADYAAMKSVSVSLSALATKLGFASVSAMAEANAVPLKSFYTAVANVIGADATVSSSVKTTMLGFGSDAQTSKAISMKVLFQFSSSANAQSSTAGLLDLVAGSFGALNGSTPINNYLGATLGILQNLSPAFSFTPGPHTFCGGTGDSFSASSITVSGTNGRLNPTGLPIHVVSSGLVDKTYTQDIYSDLPYSITVPTTDFSVVSAGCESGVDKLAVNVGARNIGVTMSGSSIGGTVTLNNGKVVQYQFNLKYTATVKLPAVSNFTISVPPSSYNTAYYPNGTTPSVDIGYAGTTWSTFQYQSGGGAPSTDDSNRIKTAILDAIVKPWYDTSNPSNMLTNVINPILASMGSSIYGPSFMLDGNAATGCSGGSGSVRLAG